MNTEAKNVLHLHLLFRNIFKDILRQDKTPISKYEMLLLIMENENLKIGDLSTTMNITRPNLTPIIDELVSEGSVERVEDTDDKRITRLKITKKGEENLGENLNVIVPRIREFEKKYTKEEMEAIRTHLKELEKLLR